MDDEKMIRAVLAGHALQGLLSTVDDRGNPRYSPVEAANYAVQFSDALLVELKKDSPAPVPESAPPLADDARAPGDVSIGDRSDAPSAAKDASPAAGPHEHRVCNPDDAEVVARSPLSSPKCEAYGCERQGVHVFRFTRLDQGYFCGIHIYVRPESILIEWHKAAKKARAA